MKRSIGIAVAAAAVIAGGALLTPKPSIKSTSNYFVEEQTYNGYTVYEKTKDGKRGRVIGMNLNKGQMQEFTK